MRVKRADRVSGLVQRELSALLLTKTKDPRLDLVTVTGVSMTDDLRIARVYVSVPQGRARSESVLAGLKSALGFLRHELSRRLDLRYTPALHFIYDESFDRADNVNRILRDIIHETGETSDDEI